MTKTILESIITAFVVQLMICLRYENRSLVANKLINLIQVLPILYMSKRCLWWRICRVSLNVIGKM